MIRASVLSIAATGLLGGCAAQTAVMPPPAPVSAAAAAPTAPPQLGLDDPAPDPMRWTYGSGEAAAASIQAWRDMADYAIAAAARKPAASVPLGLPGAAGGVATTACTGKKPAVILDMDETVVLNLGYEYWLTRGNRHSEEAFAQWADSTVGIAPVPGAVTGIRRMREAGIAVIYNTNRPASAAAGSARVLEAAGVGSAVHKETLFLMGDDAMGSNKDVRRKTISDRWCVVALGGDNLGDFAHILNDTAQSVQQRRIRSARGEIAQLWGNGWFLIPNAAYGFWQKGAVGEVFPPDARWEPRPPAIMEQNK